MRLIGIAGPAGSGKTTAAAYMARQWGWNTMAFADPIKDILASLFDMPRSQFENTLLDREHKEQPVPGLGVSPRRLMQTLGTEWGRQLIHPDLWLLMTQRRIGWLEDTLPNEYAGIVIHDVRFDNEARWIRQAGGRIVRVTSRAGSACASHSSEAGLPPHCSDIHLPNDGRLDDLFRALEQLGERENWSRWP